MSDEPWRLADVEDVILVAGPDAPIVQEVQELPEDQGLVLPLREPLFDQHLIPQVCKIVAHVLAVRDFETAQRNVSTLVLVLNS